MGGMTGYSSNIPGLRTMYRVLNTWVVRRFRGLNTYTNISEVGPDQAIDCAGVICSNAGNLERFRTPTVRSTAPNGIADGFSRIYDFQQANGTRHILAVADSSVYYINNDAIPAPLWPNPILIENTAADSGLWDFATANNIAFAANGQQMMKWTGTKWQKWGIPTPAAAPSNFSVLNLSLTRTANVVTISGYISGSLLALNSILSTPSVAGITVMIEAATDATFDGTFTSVAAAQFSWNNAGADAVCTAAVTVYQVSAVFPVDNVTRAGGVSTLHLNAILLPGASRPDLSNLNVTIAGLTVASFNGTFFITNFDAAAKTIQFNQPTLPDIVSAPDAGTAQFGNNNASQLQWRCAYGNSSTGHVGSASDSTPGVPLLMGATFNYILQAAAPPDTQVDQIYWYRTLAEGSDFYLATIRPYTASGDLSELTFIDRIDDTGLDTAIIAQLQNNDPPLVCTNLSVFQGRVFASGIVGAPQDIIYSGYERILSGRPEESFPPYNRLRLAIGADAVAGHGVIQAGVVAFSRSNQMYMFRGIVEDITTTAPLLFSAYLEQLPWQIGCFSHQSIASTPYGLAWFASDKTIKVYNGTEQPSTASLGFQSLLNRITPGTETNVRGRYVSWVDREWYVISFAIDGSAANNVIVFMDLNPDPALNAGAFPLYVEADDVAVVADVNGKRRLLITSNGVISEIGIQSDNMNGISQQTIPSTSALNNAYWRGGYFGADTPQTRKMFRWGRLKADRGGFHIQAFMVNDESATEAQPDIFAYDGGVKFSINRKYKRGSLMIVFPPTDNSANMLELQLNAIPTGDD